MQIKEKALGSGVCADCLRPDETDFAIAKASSFSGIRIARSTAYLQ